MIKLLVKLPIFKRLIPSIIKKLNIKNYTYKRDGLTYELDLRYLVDKRFYLFGWDQDIINYLNNYIKEKSCDYFFDIGSCWGVYGLQIANKNPKIKIFAFDVFEKKSGTKATSESHTRETLSKEKRNIFKSIDKSRSSSLFFVFPEPSDRKNLSLF